MCQKCFTRSAAVLAAIVTSSPIPAPADDDEQPHRSWDGPVVDAFRTMVVSLDDYARTGTENDGYDDALRGLTSEQVFALGTLMEAFKKHVNTISKITMVELSERTARGDQPAIDLLKNKTDILLGELGEIGISIPGNAAEMLKNLGLSDLAAAHGKRPIDPSLN